MIVGCAFEARCGLCDLAQTIVTTLLALCAAQHCAWRNQIRESLRLMRLVQLSTAWPL